MVTGPYLLVIFGLSILFLLLTIIRFKLNPFLALILTTILTGFAVRMPLIQITDSMASGFGNTLKGIGLVIGLGIMFGKILSDSGAMKQIASFMIRKFGAKNATLSIGLTGFLVSIPVFFDAAFVILVSLAKNVSRLSKIPVITLVTSLAIGLIASHNMVIPTPGPVEVGNSFHVSMGLYVFFAIVISIPAVLVGGWLYGVFLGKRDPEVEPEDTNSDVKEKEIAPTEGLSIFILLLPIFLILIGSVASLALNEVSTWSNFFEFIGNKNVAMFISVLAAIFTLYRYMENGVNDSITEAAKGAGMIILITGAGGSFGYLINQSGIGNYLVSTLTDWNVSILFLGFLLGAILRGALGSSTVALVTAASILGSLVSHVGMQPIFIALSICAGGMCLSLPNDSGFWVVSRFANLSVTQTLKSWTLGSSIAGLVAFVLIYILDKIF
ncbi:MAG: GntP family permease [Bacteroidales bacterium]|jgi:GntP family gluconate:H+ symporter|nr:GntP family permease [Bacteroidales bacterium]